MDIFQSPTKHTHERYLVLHEATVDNGQEKRKLTMHRAVRTCREEHTRSHISNSVSSPNITIYHHKPRVLDDIINIHTCINIIEIGD